MFAQSDPEHVARTLHAAGYADGTDDFLVLNGAQGTGPVQLIAGFR